MAATREASIETNAIAETIKKDLSPEAKKTQLNNSSAAHFKNNEDSTLNYNNNNNRNTSSSTITTTIATNSTNTTTHTNTTITTASPANRMTVANSSSTTRSHKRSANDYRFGKSIGEGSFSTVYLAKDIHTNKEVAIKVCEKQLIIREKKERYIKREREVMHMLSGQPGFVNLICTFQDQKNLYFVMTLAKNGDLLPYINKVGAFDFKCTQFYIAELILALECMHKKNIVHRDLKPENILFDENMHTLIADFGSARILDEGNDEVDLENRKRTNSFVGTAYYVSPEILKGEQLTKAADLWALGCIIYQMISGMAPFRAGSEYLIFQKILECDLKFPDGFNKTAKDLVQRLIQIDPGKRLGAKDEHDLYESIRSHEFFDGINWENLRTQTPPPIHPYLPGLDNEEESRLSYSFPENLEPGFNDRQLTRLLGLELGTSDSTKPRQEQSNLSTNTIKDDKWSQFTDGEEIIKQGLVNKRKGLFARKRMLLLTTGPRLIYIDPINMVKKGEIPMSRDLKVETKNFKIFFVHTPNRTYYLEDTDGFALQWSKAIEDVQKKYFDKTT